MTLHARELLAFALLAAFVIATVMNLDAASALFVDSKDYVVATFGGFFAWTASLCLIFVIGLGLLPQRFNVRLGDAGERPEFTNLAWFAMLFSAGLASGVLYWATAEPITHFQGNPHLTQSGVQPFSAAAAQSAVTLTIFHWGLHGWGFYVLVGLSIAYSAFRHDQPLTLSTSLYPLLGDRCRQWPGVFIDLIGVFGTVFGVATSIGLAVGGMNAAMSELFGFSVNTTNQLLIIALVAGLGVVSVVSGISRGIRRLSEINVYLSSVLLMGILLLGPTGFLLGFVVTSFGDYVTQVMPMGFWVANNAPEEAWQGAWTVFYWGWWLAWAPFVGLFVARISRGRTLREFVLGVLLVPTLVIIVWMSVFGGTALHGELGAGASIVEQVNEDYALGTVSVIRRLDILVLPLICLVGFLLFTWLITSIDSATLVVCTLLRREPHHVSNRQKTVWGLTLGLLSAVLLYAGGLNALQAASIVTGLPIGFLLLAIGVGLTKELMKAP